MYRSNIEKITKRIEIESIEEIILNDLDLGIVLFNEAGVLLYANYMAKQLEMIELVKKEIPIDYVLKGKVIQKKEIVLNQKGKLPIILSVSAKRSKIPFLEQEVVLIQAYDYSKVKWEKHRLEVSEKRYKSLCEQNPDIVCWLDLNGRILSVNPAVEKIIGFPSSQLVNKNFIDFIVPEDRGKGERQFQKALLGEAQNFEITSLHHKQDTVALNVTYIPISTDKNVIGIYIIAKDITKKKQSEEMIHYLAYHDTLTGLPNRRLFNERLQHELEKAKRYQQPLAVMFIDLDRFKYINDSLGHTMGDFLLKEVANRLKRIIRTGDTISRLGGDEFTIILSDSTLEETKNAANRILDLFAQPFIIEGQEYVVTPSIGISLYPTDGEDIETLIKNADTAMYHTKEEGKNNFRFYTHEMNQAISRKMLLEKDLRKALKNNEFEIYYQPQINTLNKGIIGIEALIRWKHPKMGLISPGEFIPLAEETGLIIPIGEWVLHAAIAQNKAWQLAGFSPMKVAVNLSILQFQDKSLVYAVDKALNEVKLDPKYLELEITESVAMTNVDFVIKKLNELKKLGIQISIDDFGTGYSSLSYLKKFPIDTLKIDQSFMRQMTESSDDAAIVRAIIAMAHSLNLKVVAEGVENESQMSFLHKLQCIQQQGYLFSKPIPVNEFENNFIRLQEMVRE